MNRLKENNEKIALILSKHGKTIGDESESLAQEGIAQTCPDRIPGKVDKTSREWFTAGDKK